MVDLGETIAPKSDQLNADDLIVGPRTIDVTDVRLVGGEQPVAISYKGDGGKPYKPCKSMRRVLVQIWGRDGAEYIGRRMTLYRDPDAQYGGMKVGGIRISHMSHMEGSVQLALTERRGMKKVFNVAPLKDNNLEPSVAIDLDALKLAASQASERGIDDLQAWWGTITVAEQKAMKPFMDDYKKVAAGIVDDGEIAAPSAAQGA